MTDRSVPPPYTGPVPPPGRPPAVDALHLLFMCTANQCRSPMAAAIARDLLDERGVPAAVASCGLLEGGHPASRGTVKAMDRRGLDVADHRSRQIDEGIVSWATLVVAMERRHLLRVVELVPEAVDRAFTLPELAELALVVGPRLDGHRPAEWVARCAAARDPAAALSYSTDLDLPDPMGGPARGYRRTAERIESMLRTVLTMLYPSPG